MDNNQNKFSNADDYDLILEEKEKELKKEKRNKVILASSLALLLLLGSTATVAPIISVAVNNKNIHNSSNSNGSNDSNINGSNGSNNDGSNGSNNGDSIDTPANIPNELTFTDSDITTLINGYQDEIKLRKLVYLDFENDFANITKKYITASNIRIGSLVKNATIERVKNKKKYFNISITLDEKDRTYLADKKLSKAKLFDNLLTFTLKENTNLTFCTPIKVTIEQLNNIKNKIQENLDNNRKTIDDPDRNYWVSEIVKNEFWTNSTLITDIKYENGKLIIEPRFPYFFECDFETDMVANGNIIFYDLVQTWKSVIFTNLDKLYETINDFVSEYTYAEFNEYLANNLDFFKKFALDNLENLNNYEVNIDKFELDEQNLEFRIWIKFEENTYYLYEKHENDLISVSSTSSYAYIYLKNLDFFDDSGSPLNWFTYNKVKDGFQITGVTELGKQQTSFKFSRKMKYFYSGALSNCENLRTVDFSLLDQIYFQKTDSEDVGGTIADNLLSDCVNLETVIMPKNQIRNIGCNAFKNCSKLQNIDIANVSGEIRDAAFYNCTKLSSPNTLPLQATKIGNSAFYNCTKLGSPNVITLQATEIGNSAFYNCSSLKKVDARARCKYIGSSAFENSGLIWFKGGANSFRIAFNTDGQVNVNIWLDNAYYLGFDVFKNCTNLQWVEFRGGYEWGKYSPFTGCNVTYYTAYEWSFNGSGNGIGPTYTRYYVYDIYNKQDQTGISQFLTSSTPE